MFRNWSGRFFGGELADIYEHLESHSNDPATINDLDLTVMKHDPGHVRNIATEQHHGLIMLTRGRAQRLVLKAAEPEVLQACRPLFPRYEPVSTVTAVAKLVELLTTPFTGDTMAAVTDVERQVKSWEHEAKETLSDLINIGFVIKGLEKRGFRDHLLINTAGTTEWSTLKKGLVNDELGRKNIRPTPMDLSAVGQDQKFQGNCPWFGIYGHIARDSRKRAEHNNQGKQGQRQRQTQWQKGRKGSHEMEGMNLDPQNTQNARTQIGRRVRTCGITRHGEQPAQQLTPSPSVQG